MAGYPPQDPNALGYGERNPFERQRPNWFDRQFADTSIVVLVLFPLCCGIVAFVFGLIGTLACQDPKARRNAIIVLCISIAWIGIAVVLNVLSVMNQPQPPVYR